MPIDGARTLRSRVASARNLERNGSVLLVDFVDHAYCSCLHWRFKLIAGNHFVWSVLEDMLAQSGKHGTQSVIIS
ncbi:hypothetical protein A6X21_00190 [Planctopirus hydrillae]|uniref:Uncharacterized protein n=1 Tax=Planctopirus hydrillae TaxID=1841610 RepID=A0A1C3EAS6_9PLAN|nr:hypothetical protein A6X21_00190 [Planctopirus hydrillae]